MMHWLAQAPALAVAVLVVFGPGLLMGLGLKLRGLALWAAAPLLSTATIAALAIIFGVIGVPWNLLTVAAGCAATIAVAWAVGLALGRRRAMAHERLIVTFPFVICACELFRSTCQQIRKKWRRLEVFHVRNYGIT